jgi:hypothetical protein
MIVFPAGLYYGRVPVEHAPRLIELYGEGLLDPRYFRGRSSSRVVVQAAEAMARADIPDDTITAFTHRSTTADPGRWTVEFDHGGDTVIVRLAESLSAPLLTTCEATVALPVREFERVSVETITA